MENANGFLELLIAAIYTAHTFLSYHKEGRDLEASPNEPKNRRRRPSPETVCLLAIALSYYAIAAVTLTIVH